MNRAYPDRPFIGVGAVIVQDGRVLLVQRRSEPLAGRWSLPGGAVELGETLEAAVIREMREETGLEVQVGPVIEVLDRITHDDAGRVHYHYVLVDYLCWPLRGRLLAASDVLDAVFAEPDRLETYALGETAVGVIARAMQLDAARRPREPRHSSGV